MVISISINNQNNIVKISCQEKDVDIWDYFSRMLTEMVPGIVERKDGLELDWNGLLISRGAIASFVKNHANVSVYFDGDLAKRLEKDALKSYSHAVKNKKQLDEDFIRNSLAKAGFSRDLTPNQIHNLKELGSLPAGATFSVPGAGKTTEALAYFFLNASCEDKLLVVAPKNAFGAWDEQLKECTPSINDEFVRLRGGAQKIDRLLRDNPRFMIINYEMYPKVKDLIRRELVNNQVFMFLDESHRIKSGKLGVSPEAILETAILPKRKLIMSGTPMPQSIKDLMPQVEFLYPEIKNRINETNVVDIIKPIFVRTTSRELGIPAVERKRTIVDMEPLQQEVYETLRSETKRQLLPYISDYSRASLRSIGNKVMKVMQFVSNPALLSMDMQYAFDPRIGELLLRTNGPKIDYACKRARELVGEGHKVIIWSSFIANIHLITERLSDLGADYIDGSVDAGNEDVDDSREWKIKEFHNNKDKWVLVLNPAAASEGISLHRVCQYAIYVDRSFNAAQYLQSEDRIHRLGLEKGKHPTVEIIECRNTIDQLINARLEVKVQNMARALEDPSLSIDAIPYDFEAQEEEDIDDGDVYQIMNYFFGDN